MSSESAYYLFGFMLDVCFVVGSGILYMMALQAEDRLVAGGSAFSFVASCVGSAIFFERLV